MSGACKQIQYIPWNVHMILSVYFMKHAHDFVTLWFVVVISSILSAFTDEFTHIFCRIALQAMEQWCDCPSASEVTLNDLSKMVITRMDAWDVMCL